MPIHPLFRFYLLDIFLRFYCYKFFYVVWGEVRHSNLLPLGNKTEKKTSQQSSYGTVRWKAHEINVPLSWMGTKWKQLFKAWSEETHKKKRKKNKNNEGIWRQDMMKNTHGLNRCWVVFDDILRFADYIPVVLSHTIHLSFFRHHIHQER